MPYLDYFGLLTVVCVFLLSTTSVICETDADSAGFLASYNDSEDPDTAASAELTSSLNPLINEDDPPKASERPADVIDIRDDPDPTTDDDIYVDPEYSDEDSVEAEEDEDQEGEVLNWVQSTVGAGIFDDAQHNEVMLSKIPEDHNLVYPVQIRKNEVLGLDTHDRDRTKPGVHYYHTNILFRVDGRKYKLKLALNKQLISREMKQKRNIDAKTQIIEEGALENCFYHGEVRKSVGSKVIISTCNGISGIILLDNITYAIQPLKPIVSTNETRWPHVMYQLPESEPIHKSANGRGMWTSFRDLHIGEFMRRRKIMSAMKNEFDVLSATKRLQLGLIADHTVMMRTNGSLTSSLIYLGQLANILDAVLQTVNIRVTLKYVELWNSGNLVAVDKNTRMTLNNVFVYRQDALSFVDVDTVHLISGQAFYDDEVGMAIPDSICTRRAVSVSYDPSDIDPLRTANGILHMIGYQFGLRDQSMDSCLCPHAGGCLMSVTANGTVPHHALHFSLCAETSLEEALLGGLGTCLLEGPPQFLSYGHYQEVFTQTCGNGHVERGEECDCLSVQECRLKDPCCNPKTCLLQPWATCRFGDCCENCTVVPANYMCRLAISQCDVPEFCDGTSGYCPHNAMVQNGWPCKEGDGFCYQGLCQTYSDQCHMIWGSGAKPADDKCYETFNTAGRFNGHCGTDKLSKDYIKCDRRDVTCGLLHCEGGLAEPSIGKDNVFSTTTVNLAGVNYECKIISSHNIEHFPYYGMVQDGTKCGNNSICLGTRCVSLDTITYGVCPLGENNLVCSGHGVCTSELKCYCNGSYVGANCSEYRRQTTLSPPKLITALVSQIENHTVPPPVNITPPTTSMQTTTIESPVITKADRSVSTIWLIIVLSSVAGGALLVLGCCMMCYRRKSNVTFKKKKKKKKKNPSIFGSLTSFSSGNSKSSRSKEDSGDEVTNRIISFGNMPSYRADKIKKVMRKTSGEQSDSEHNASNRSSAEIKVIHTLPLAKPPERGILKKYPRSTDDLQSSSDTEPLRQKKRTPAVSMEMELLGSSRKNHREGSSRRDDGEADEMLPHNYEEIDDVECCIEDECGSCCSCDADDEKKFEACPEGDFCDCCSDNRDQQTQTDPESADSPEIPRQLSSDSLEGAKNKIIKLKNINELLKQIDEQFNNVLRQTAQGDTSPTGSDEIRGSETEADRNFPRNSFYKQSDIEEGYSPPHRSPILSPNPSTQRSSTRYSSNTGSDSQDGLSSPTGLLSPIQPLSPVQGPAPIASPSPFAGPVPSHFRDPLKGPRHTTSTPKSTPPKGRTPQGKDIPSPAYGPELVKPKEPEKRSPALKGMSLSGDQEKVSPPRSDSGTSQKSGPAGRHSPDWREPTPSTIPAVIPKCPSRPAPEPGHQAAKRNAPERSTPSKPSARSAQPESPKNINNSSNKDGALNKPEPLVTAVPYRGAKSGGASGSPTPQLRNKPGHSASGSPTPQPRHRPGLPTSESRAPEPQNKLGLSTSGHARAEPLNRSGSSTSGSDVSLTVGKPGVSAIGSPLPRPACRSPAPRGGDPSNGTAEGSEQSKKRNTPPCVATMSPVSDRRESTPSPGSTRSERARRPDKMNKSAHSPKTSGSFLSKLTQPLFENNPFKRRGSHSNDGNSISEGYFSDHADVDEAVIVREIPGNKPVDLPFMPNPNGSYTRAPGSPGSPEDINV